jgi:putative spermidine/putrescine transport system substrate-binding protein
MSKKILLIVSLLAIAALVAACGGGAAPAATQAATEPAAATQAATEAATQEAAATTGEGAVSIVAWPGYIENGSSDPAYDWVTDFEKETGCKVDVKVAGTSDEMVTLMNQKATYDLVTASGDASLRLIYGGRIAAINTDDIANWSNVDERLQNGAWHTVDTNGDGTPEHYGTPYQWGPNVLMYSTKAFGDVAPTSWDVVFHEQKLADGKSNTGRVQAYKGAIYIADATLYLMYNNPDLKITDPYELDQAQYDAALDLLRGQRKLVSRYWDDYTVQIDDFTNEDLAASTAWPYQVNTLSGAGEPIASVIPVEGATGWADTTMMAIDAPHPQCALLWMNHSLDPKVNGDVASWFGSAPAVPAACEASTLLTPDGCKANGIDNLDSIHFWKTPIADCGDDRGAVCISYDQWVTDYIAIIGS